MKIDIKVPSVGESVVEGTIGAILKPSGSMVKVDEEILEIETDKVNQAIYAPVAGQLFLSVKTGEVVKVGQTIGTIDADAKAASAPLPKQESPKPTAAKPTPSTLPEARVSIERSLASEALPSAPKAAPPAPKPSGQESRRKLTKLRRVIAERLVQVKNQTAMLTTFNEVDMSAIMAVREKEQESFVKKHGVKLGFMSFFVKACAAALKEYPDLNSRIEGDEIVTPATCNIGIAVGTDKGLFVPVLRSADALSSAQIEQQLKVYADKARAGTISVDDMQGGTFTITNGGVFGSMLSTPILNPPQSGILGMHNIVKRPVVINDQIVIRPIMYLALSYDHRIVDGKESISFLVHIKKNLEEPARLLLDL